MLLRRYHKKTDDPVKTEETVDEVEEVEEVEETEEEVTEETVDYDEKTVPQLKKIADEREIEYKSNVTKPELIDLLTE